MLATSKATGRFRVTMPGTFDPQLMANHQRRFQDFDDKIISMYAREMSVREIRLRSFTASNLTRSDLDGN